MPLVLPLKGLWEEAEVFRSEGTGLGWQEWNCFELCDKGKKFTCDPSVLGGGGGAFLCSIRNRCTRNMGTNVEKKKVSFQ